MTTPLKIMWNGDLRRLRVAEGCKITVVEALAKEAFGNAPEKLVFKFTDDEGDLCTVGTDDELKEAFSAVHGVLKLVLIANSDEAKATPQEKQVEECSAPSLFASENDIPDEGPHNMQARRGGNAPWRRGRGGHRGYCTRGRGGRGRGWRFRMMHGHHGGEKFASGPGPHMMAHSSHMMHGPPPHMHDPMHAAHLCSVHAATPPPPPPPHHIHFHGGKHGTFSQGEKQQQHLDAKMVERRGIRMANQAAAGATRRFVGEARHNADAVFKAELRAAKNEVQQAFKEAKQLAKQGVKEAKRHAKAAKAATKASLGELGGGGSDSSSSDSDSDSDTGVVGDAKSAAKQLKQAAKREKNLKLRAARGQAAAQRRAFMANVRAQAEIVRMQVGKATRKAARDTAAELERQAPGLALKMGAAMAVMKKEVHKAAATAAATATSFVDGYAADIALQKAEAAELQAALAASAKVTPEAAAEASRDEAFRLYKEWSVQEAARKAAVVAATATEKVLGLSEPEPESAEELGMALAAASRNATRPAKTLSPATPPTCTFGDGLGGTTSIWHGAPSTKRDNSFSVLTSMGFTDAKVNANLLEKHGGDLRAVVSELLATSA